MIWTTKRIKHDPAYDELEAEIRDEILVPADMNAGFARQYGVAPDQPIGRYIVKLNKSIKSGAHLTKNQARFIMLLTLCGILHGVRKYCLDDGVDGHRDAKEAYNYLKVDDKYAKAVLKSIIVSQSQKDDCSFMLTEKWNEFVNKLNKKGCYYIGECDETFYKSRAASKYDEALEVFYTSHNGDDDSRFLRDMGRMFCRHTHPEYDARNSFWDVKNPEFQRVYDICDLMKAVRAMGDQYVLAPVFNLYAESVLRCVQDCKKHLSKKH